MGDPSENAWDHVTILHEGGRSHLVCNYCLTKFSMKIGRIREHLSAHRGQVAACRDVPHKIFMLFGAILDSADELKREGGKPTFPPKPANVPEMDLEEYEMRQAVRNSLRDPPPYDAAFQRDIDETMETFLPALRRIRSTSSAPSSATPSSAAPSSAPSAAPSSGDRKQKGIVGEGGSSQKKKKTTKQTLMYLWNGIASFYKKTGLKYHSSHKKPLKELATVFREHGRDPSPPSNSDEINLYVSDSDPEHASSPSIRFRDSCSRQSMKKKQDSDDDDDDDDMGGGGDYTTVPFEGRRHSTSSYGYY